MELSLPKRLAMQQGVQLWIGGGRRVKAVHEPLVGRVVHREQTLVEQDRLGRLPSMVASWPGSMRMLTCVDLPSLVVRTSVERLAGWTTIGPPCLVAH